MGAAVKRAGRALGAAGADMILAAALVSAMVCAMRLLSISLAPLGLLLLSGCCGGYAVVRTTIQEHAAVREGGELARAPGGTSVLHYSRLGEPPNACGSEVKYLDDLWIQVPSLAAGQAYTIGAPGVTAFYTRQEGQAEPVRATSIAGQVAIKEQTSDGLETALKVTITLPSGATVKLDDDYAFHPLTAGKSLVDRGFAGRGAPPPSCRTAF